jgi:Transposase DDE domain
VGSYRDRLLKAEVARKFLAELLTHRQVRALLSDEHFSVDGTQVQAWASMKSFVAKDGSGDPPSPGRNGGRDFHGEKRRNETHASTTTEPEAKLYKKGKGKEAKLSYIGNVMTENRNGFVVEAELRQVSGSVEREAAAAMIVRHSPGAQRITVGGDKAFDTADFVADMRALNVTPHVAQNTTSRRSAIDGRTTRHAGYETSQQKRKRVEEPFGWGKTIGGLARPMLRGIKKLDFKFIWTMAAYDLIKLPRLIEAAA